MNIEKLEHTVREVSTNLENVIKKHVAEKKELPTKQPTNELSQAEKNYIFNLKKTQK